MIPLSSSPLYRMTACLLGRTCWPSATNHTLRPLVPVLFLVAVLIYGVADRLQDFVLGIFIPQYHCPYAVALCFAQVLVSLLVLNLLHVVGLVPLRSYSRSLGEKLLVPAICNSVHCVLSMWAQVNSSDAGLFPFTLRLLPIVTVAFSFCPRLVSSPPSIHTSVLVSIPSCTSFIIAVSRGPVAADSLELVYAPLALILQGLSLTWMGKVSKAESRHSPDARASVFDLYHTLLVTQCWVLGVLWMLHPDSPWRVLRLGSWHSLLFLGYLLAILLLRTLMNLLVCVSALSVSPVAAAILHSARQVMQPFLQL